MGIGFACAAELVSAGARVVICARGEGALQEAGAKLRILPGAVVRAVRAARFGGDRVAFSAPERRDASHADDALFEAEGRT